MNIIAILFFSGLVAANPALILRRGSPTTLPAAGVTAIGTFNSYTAQTAAGSGQDTNCGTYPQNSFTQSPFGAAVADLSQDLAFSPCSDPSVPSAFPTACSTGDITGGSTGVLPTPTSGYRPPNCKNSVPCNMCFKVTNQGALGQWNGKDVGGKNNCAYVKIIDSCPHNSAYNYCKQVANPPIPTNQRCMAQGQNALDMDEHAYQQLTGIDYVSAKSAGNTPPNLNILVQSVQCSDVPPGGQCAGGSTTTTGGASSPTGTTSSGTSGPTGAANTGKRRRSTKKLSRAENRP